MGKGLKQMTKYADGLYNDTQRLWKRCDELEAQIEEARQWAIRMKRERDAAERKAVDFGHAHLDASIECERLERERDKAREWAWSWKVAASKWREAAGVVRSDNNYLIEERDAARANQIKGRCGECLHYRRSNIDECLESGWLQHPRDYCSRWEARE